MCIRDRSCTVMEIWSLKHSGATTLTFWGHAVSSVTWPFHSPYGVSYRVTWPLSSACVISYWWSIVTIPLSCNVSEIYSLKDIGVTTLTFWGHVTSSVMWPFYSPCGISCNNNNNNNNNRICIAQVCRMTSEALSMSNDFRGAVGGQWWTCVYLAPLVRYKASK